MNYEPIAKALHSLGYSGYASAEAFPIPDAATTARSTIKEFRRWLRS